MHRLIAPLLLVILVLAGQQARADGIDDAYEALSASALTISSASFNSVRHGVGNSLSRATHVQRL